MSQAVVQTFAVSLDGYGSGACQSAEAPFGHAGTRLLDWFMATRTFQQMQGGTGGSTGVDDALIANWPTGIGAEIMGRNKFGPSAARGSTTAGKVGGAMSRRSTPRSSC